MPGSSDTSSPCKSAISYNYLRDVYDQQKDHTAHRAILNIPNGSADITIHGITIDGILVYVSGNRAAWEICIQRLHIDYK